MKYGNSTLLFLRYFIAALVVLFLISVLQYWLHFRADLVDRHLLWSDFFKIILTGGLGFSGQIFLCSMVFSLTWLFARKKLKRLTSLGLIFLAISAGFGFYLVGFVVPKANLYNYSMYWDLLEKSDADYRPLELNSKLFEGASGCSSYSDLGRIRDSMETEKDSAWNRKLNFIRNLADPGNVQQLLNSDEYGKMFSPEDFEGVTTKYEGFNRENAQRNIESIAQMMQVENKMREESILSYTDRRTEMAFYPLYYLLFCIMAVFAGKLLTEISFVPQLAIVLLVILPVPVFVMSLPDKIFAQWIGLFVGAIGLLILYRAGKNKVIHSNKN